MLICLMEQEQAITSPANPTVKMLKSLAQKKYRDEEGLFLVEGLRHVREAAAEKWHPAILCVAPDAQAAAQTDIAACRQNGGRVILMSMDILSRITGRDNPQPVLAAFRPRWSGLEALEQGLWVVLEEVRDPGNLGTIMRTADAAGARGIALVGQTCDPFAPDVVRATVGSFARIALVRTGLEAFLSWRAAYTGQMIGTTLAADSVDYRSPAYAPERLLLVMGNEQNGLSAPMAAACGQRVRIPMAGGTESLNLAVSTALMLYESRRKLL